MCSLNEGSLVDKQQADGAQETARARAQIGLVGSAGHHDAWPAAAPLPPSADALVHELRAHELELETQNSLLRATQLELEQARDRYLDLFESAPVGYLTLTRQATIAEVNLTAGALLGIDRDRMRDRHFANFVQPEDRNLWHRFFASLIETRQRQGVELRLVGGTGLALDIRLDGIALYSADHCDVVRITLKDISARKRLETMLAAQKAETEARARALAEAERFARATIDALPYRLCVLDEHGRIVATNKMWRESVEAPACPDTRPVACTACLAVPCAMPCWPAETAVVVDRAVDELLAGTRQEFALEYECRSDAGARWFEMQVSRFPCEGPVRLVVLHEDITERKRAVRAEQASAARLKRLGLHLETLREEQGAMIARELHDELGATLTMLKLGVATLGDELARTDPVKARFGEILSAVDSALQVVKRVSSNLRPATLDTLGLVATIRSYADQFSRSTGIATALRLPDYVRLSRVGATTVFRIVQEGLTNVARHAGADRVTISARKCMAASGDGGVLIVRLRDNGAGIAEGEQSRQDAFGLIGMHERAQHLGGSLAIRSRPGEGTRLTLHIPLDERNGGQ